jgi:hypothetical protein
MSGGRVSLFCLFRDEMAGPRRVGGLGNGETMRGNASTWENVPIPRRSPAPSFPGTACRRLQSAEPLSVLRALSCRGARS